jgi:hypothetical protein
MGIVTFKSDKTPKQHQALLWHTETPRQWWLETLFIEPKSVSVDGVDVCLEQTWEFILEKFPDQDWYQVDFNYGFKLSNINYLI